VRVALYKPINENVDKGAEPERSTHFLRAITTLAPVEPMLLAQVTKLVAEGRLDEVLERSLRGPDTSNHCLSPEKRKGFRLRWRQANWKTMWSSEP
jgi:hypothetical protein